MVSPGVRTAALLAKQAELAAARYGGCAPKPGGGDLRALSPMAHSGGSGVSLLYCQASLSGLMRFPFA